MPCRLSGRPFTKIGPQFVVCFHLGAHPISDSRKLKAPTAPPMILPDFLLSTFPSGKNPVRIFKVPTSPGLGFPVPEAFTVQL